MTNILKKKKKIKMLNFQKCSLICDHTTLQKHNDFIKFVRETKNFKLISLQSIFSCRFIIFGIYRNYLYFNMVQFSFILS